MIEKQVVIVGYHRSGTSAVTQNCQAAGLFVGEDLLGANPSNPFGHFEDREFFEINEAILNFNFESWAVTSDFSPIINQQIFDVALSQVSKRTAEYETWGFKDPRTCILLDFWHSVLPNPKYLVCLRHYEACIDSIIRRRLFDLTTSENDTIKEKYSRQGFDVDEVCVNWCVYMSSVLKFLRTKETDSLVLRIDMLSQDDSISELMNKSFGTKLEVIPLSETFKPEIFKKPGCELPVSSKIRRVADGIWNELQKYC